MEAEGRDPSLADATSARHPTVALSSNGKTSGFDPLNTGSSPVRAANMSRLCEFLAQEECGDMTEKQGAGLLNQSPEQSGLGANPSVSAIIEASSNSKIAGSEPVNVGATPAASANRPIA